MPGVNAHNNFLISLYLNAEWTTIKPGTDKNLATNTNEAAHQIKKLREWKA